MCWMRAWRMRILRWNFSTSHWRLPLSTAANGCASPSLDYGGINLSTPIRVRSSTALLPQIGAPGPGYGLGLLAAPPRDAAMIARKQHLGDLAALPQREGACTEDIRAGRGRSFRRQGIAPVRSRRGSSRVTASMQHHGGQFAARKHIIADGNLFHLPGGREHVRPRPRTGHRAISRPAPGSGRRRGRG